MKNWEELKDEYKLNLEKIGNKITITRDKHSKVEFDVKQGVEIEDLLSDKGFCNFIDNFFSDPLKALIDD
jgi:hypothetical protein